MSRPLFLALLAVLALPAGASAAPPKLSPHPSEVSASGRVTIEAANPNRHALRGSAAVIVAGRTVARRAIRLPKRAVSTVALRLDASARRALRTAGGRATIVLRLRRGGGRSTTARRKVVLRVADGAPQAPGTPAPSTGGDNGGGDRPVPTRPASGRWIGRMGTEGPYDDLELTVVNGQIQITKPPTVPVMCFENGGAYRSALSLEFFDAPGPWTVGTDGSVAGQGIAVNQLVSAGARPITYKLTGSSLEPGRLTGTLGMSFFDSRYDPFSNTIAYINCAGSQSFDAVPAG
jgi:hypothetical protein